MPSPSLRVLYVDDETALLDIAKIFLERTEGFSVDISESATAALELLKTVQYDAIISDYQMPEMDGIEFLIQVRAAWGDIPFILFTGRGREEVVARAIDNGVDFYVQKGGDPRAQFKELAHKVRKSVERIQAVRAMRANEERMRLALDGAREAHWDINIVDGTTYFSPRGIEMLGYSPEEVPDYGGVNWRKLVHPDDIRATNDILEDHYSGKSEYFQVEQRLRMKNGEWKWMLVRGKVIEYDAAHHPVRIVGTNTDITGQKIAEQKLLLAKKDWETIFRAIGNPTLITDPDYSITDANESILALTGKTLEELKGQKCWSLFHDPKTGDLIPGCPFEKMSGPVNDAKRVVETEAFGRFFLISCTPVYDEHGNLLKAIHIATDITDIKRLEKNLKENRDYLDQIFSSVREGIAIIDAVTHTILDLNPAAIRMIGAPKEEIIGHLCHRYICPAGEGSCPITDLNQSVDNSERVLLTAEGKKIPIIKHVVPFNFLGRACLLETFIDNTERKAAHDALQEAYQQVSDAQEELRSQFNELTELKNALQVNETKFRTIVEATPDIIWEITLDGIFTYVSPRCYDILGYSVEEIIGRSIISLIEPEHQKEATEVLNSGVIRDSGILIIDFPFIHKDGRPLFINIRTCHILDDSGKRIGFRGVARDVTENRRSIMELQEEKRKVERLLEQKGMFLTQLAHDIRTPMTPIIGLGPLLLEGIPDPDARELITIFLNSIKYLQKMSEDIMVNARLNQIHTVDSVELHDLSALIDDAVEANQYLAEQKELQIINTVQPGLMVSLSKPYAHLVFRNLVNNAVKFNAHRGEVNISAAITDEMVQITVKDTGIGISPVILDKIWDELYTGDPARRDPLSKGFGLSIVKKIVELHHGSVDAFSEGYLKGSAFTVSFPRIP